MKRLNSALIFLIPLIVIVLFYFFLPLIYMLFSSFMTNKSASFENYMSIFTSKFLLLSFWNSIKLSFLSAGLLPVRLSFRLRIQPCLHTLPSHKPFSRLFRQQKKSSVINLLNCVKIQSGSSGPASGFFNLPIGFRVLFYINSSSSTIFSCKSFPK